MWPAYVEHRFLCQHPVKRPWEDKSKTCSREQKDSDKRELENVRKEYIEREMLSTENEMWVGWAPTRFRQPLSICMTMALPCWEGLEKLRVESLMVYILSEYILKPSGWTHPQAKVLSCTLTEMYKDQMTCSTQIHNLDIILHVAKSLWAADYHLHKWFYLKLLPKKSGK